MDDTGNYRSMSPTEKEGLYKRLVWLVAGYGIVLRLWQYLMNRSLWLDEAAVTLNIIDKSFKGLLGQLDYQIISPLGFLFIEKSTITILGNNEYALRFWPLLTGLLAVVLFIFIAGRCGNARASLIAVGLFCLSNWLIYYSSEVKRYSSDVAITLLIICTVLHMEEKGTGRLKILLLGIIGAVSVWISYPSTFTFLAAGIVTIIIIYRSDNKKYLPWVVIMYIIWLASTAFCYRISLSQLSSKSVIADPWRNSLAPFPFSSIYDFQWYFEILPSLMQNPGGFIFPGVALFAACLGTFSMTRDKKYTKLILLIGPVFFAFVASGMNWYPIYGRLMLFAVPAALILIAEGIDSIIRIPARLIKIGGIMLLCLLIINPLWTSIINFFQPMRGPYWHSEIRPVIEYLIKNRDTEDIIYIHHGAYCICRYYLRGKDITFIEGSQSLDSSRQYIDEIEDLRGSQRVWFIFTNAYSCIGLDEERFFIDYLNQAGKLVESYRIKGGSAYLYDL